MSYPALLLLAFIGMLASFDLSLIVYISVTVGLDVAFWYPRCWSVMTIGGRLLVSDVICASSYVRCVVRRSLLPSVSTT